MEPISRTAIFAYAKAQHGTAPEYLWAKFPNYAVLRHPQNQKWYAILMEVPPKKLGLEGQALIDIIDVKCDPLMIGSLRESKGILPAYHMNKNGWITLLLDGSVPKNQVLALLELSFAMTESKK